MDPTTAIILEMFEEDTPIINEMINSLQEPVRPLRNPMYTRPYPGHIYIREIMEGHEGRAYNCFRMSADIFRRLTTMLEERHLLVETRNMPIPEQVAIFLRVIAHADSYRSICEFLQHSLETVSRNFHNVLRGILTLAPEYIKLPTSNTRCSNHIRNNRNFFPFFKDAIGAVDGTHIPAIVALHKQSRYRNRKDFISQNVMAAVNFERQFVFVVSGWEGSAADMRVLRAAVEDGQLTVPLGKYYLVDSEYANTEKFLAPVRRHRYHLSNYRTHEQRQYNNPNELFNHRHAQLRNVVERTFGILKQRFKVLTTMRQFAFSTQADIVVACCILHNFITENNSDDFFMNMSEEDLSLRIDEDEPDADCAPESAAVGERAAGEHLRNKIIGELWGFHAARGTATARIARR